MKLYIWEWIWWIDIYQKNTSNKSKLQLIGVTCIFLSAKYFELVTPNVDDYVYITDNTYSKDLILSQEMNILNTLSWNLGSVLSIDFLERYLIAIKADSIVKNYSLVRNPF